MTWCLELLQSELAGHLVVTLLHTLWQGLVIALVLLAMLKRLPNQQAQRRYRWCVGSLLLLVLCGLGTFSLLQQASVSTTPAPAVMRVHESVVTDSEVSPPSHPNPALEQASSQPTMLPAPPMNLPQQTEPANPVDLRGWAFGLWLLGVVIMSGRLMVTLTGTYRLKQQTQAIEDPAILALFERLCRSMKISQHIRLVASPHVLQPGVIGFFRPMLLMPISMLSEVPMDDLQAIFAHELAHIRRHDFLINLAQMVIEAVLFFNPFMWWISHHIRQERESCCDLAGIETSGKPVQYAQLLLKQMTLNNRPAYSPLPAAALGFSKTPSHLQRVKRIVQPNHRPAMKISWAALLICLALTFAAGLGLWKTTDLTVTMAAELMTPQERLDKMAEIVETHGQQHNYENEEFIEVSGRITTFDGKPVPDLQFEVQTFGNGQTPCSSSIRYRDGHFKDRVTLGGSATLTVIAPGYAPIHSETYHLDANDVLSNLHLVLQDGFDTTIEVVDEQNRPIADANVSLCPTYTGGNSWSPSNQITLPTKTDGTVVFPHQTTHPVKLSIQAPGFTRIENMDLECHPDKTQRITLKAVPPTSGTVLASETGLPIANAKLFLTQKMRGHAIYSYSRSRRHETSTNQQGRFEMNSLEPGYTYAFVVRANEFNPILLKNVTPGAQNLEVVMKSELCIRGKIVGDLSQIDRCHHYQHPALDYNSRLFGYHIEENREIPITIIDNVGSFEIKGILGDRITLTPRGTQAKLTFSMPEESIDDVVIDINATQNFYNTQTRPVEYSFKAPEGYPPVEGKVRVTYLHMPKNRDDSQPLYWTSQFITVHEGKARFDCPVPGKLKLSETHELEGFWVYPDQQEEIISMNDEPYQRTIHCEAAGNIYGQTYLAPGKPMQYADLDLIVITPPASYKRIKDTQLLPQTLRSYITLGYDQSHIENGKYHMPPLPVGGTYMIMARNQQTCLLSDPVKLTPENPIQSIDLTLIGSKQIRGRIQTPQGTTAANVKVNLVVTAYFKHAERPHQDFASIPVRTDSSGSFVFENINPDKRLTYLLNVDTGSGYQPLRIKVKPGSNKTYQIKQGYRLQGQLLDDKTGWPIPGVQISARPVKDKDSPPLRSDAFTDREGRFVFSTLSKGRYRLSIAGANVVGGPKASEIVAGKTKQCTLRVRIHSWSTLKPLQPMPSEPKQL